MNALLKFFKERWLFWRYVNAMNTFLENIKYIQYYYLFYTYIFIICDRRVNITLSLPSYYRKFIIYSYRLYLFRYIFFKTILI